SEVLVEEGKTVGINTVVARIEESGTVAAGPGATPPPASSPEPPAPEPPPPAPAPEPEPAPAEPSGPLSPLVRKLAREQNLDLSQVKGTGAGGRITKQDVEARLAPVAPPAAPVMPPMPPLPPAGAPRTRIEPMSAMRMKIAEHMVLSKRTSAHVTTIHRVD